MSPTGHEPGNREITYRVGWKKGTIEPLGSRRPGSKPPEPPRTGLEKFIHRYAWRSAPFLSAKAVRYAFWILPAAGFAMTVWLASMLVRV